MGEFGMKPKEVLNAWHQAFLHKDVQALCELYTDDAVNHQVSEAPLYEKEAIKQSFYSFFEAFPNERTDCFSARILGQVDVSKTHNLPLV
jgi:ketosteroid isomerase-like protein